MQIILVLKLLILVLTEASIERKLDVNTANHILNENAVSNARLLIIHKILSCYLLEGNALFFYLIGNNVDKYISSNLVYVSNEIPVFIYTIESPYKTYKWNVSNKIYPKETLNLIGKTLTFVLFLDAEYIDNFNIGIQFLKTLPQWNSRAKFFVVSFQKGNLNLSVKMEWLFYESWHNLMLNVIAVIIKVDENFGNVEEPSQFFSYNPFIGTKHLNSKLSELGTSFKVIKMFMNSIAYRECSRSNCIILDEYLFGYKFKNMNGYNLRVSIHDHTPKSFVELNADGTVKDVGGTDGKMLRTLSNLMNFGVILLSPTHKQHTNSSEIEEIIAGSASDLVDNRADISINSKFIVKIQDELEYTYPHNKEALCIVVPKANIIPRSHGIFLPFDPCLWALCSMATVITAIFWYTIKRIMFGNASFLNVIFHAVALCISVPIRSHIFQKHGRLLFFLWVYSSMIISTMYQSSLISSLVVPKFFKDVDTLQELDEKNLKLAMFPGLRNSALTSSTNRVRISLSQKTMVTTQTLTSCLDNLIKNNDICCVYDEFSADFVVRQKKYIRNGVRLLHVMDECLAWYPEAYRVRKDWPLLSRLNTLIQRIMESGLHTKWTNDIKCNAVRQEKLSLLSFNNNVVLNLSHLQSAFYILTAGLCVSTLVFLREIRPFH
ncbi:Ionotropic receptor 884 [Blattella germanica]|nr:Ionotropic receptor 884 [Blattella germanica]